MKKLFIGNLPWSANSQSLSELFSKFASVVKADVMTDRQTGRSRGFGFVELTDDNEAEQAIAELNGMDIEGRKIIVNEARPREDRPRQDSRGGYDSRPRRDDRRDR